MVTRVFKFHPLQLLFVVGFPLGVIGLNLFYHPHGMAEVEALASHSVFVCPLHFLTDLLCPGCGVTRSLLAFFTAQFALSLYFNPWGPVLSAGLIIIWIRLLLGHSFSIHSSTFHRWAPMMAVLLVFWGIVRNL